VDVAIEIGADGVHIGQQDMEYERARKVLGPEAIIGLSIETIEQARASVRLGVDYLGVGRCCHGHEAGCGSAGGGSGPGGDTRDLTARDCGNWRDGAGERATGDRMRSDGVAVVSAICAAEDPERMARELRLAIDGALSIRAS